MDTMPTEITAALRRVENLVPILNVSDMNASRRFYVDILGFGEADWGTDDFTAMHREGGGVYLCRGGQGHPGTWVWLGFDGDIYVLYQYFREKGVTIKMPPTNFSYAMELHIEDPDGHRIRFGTDPDPGKPYADRQ